MDAQGWDARYAAATTSVWAAGPNVWVRETTEHLAPGRAVDLAAGEGRHAIWLAAHGWRVDALDFSAAGLRRGRETAAGCGLSDRITWRLADVVTERAEPGAFDLAVIAYLHVPPAALARALRGGAAALAPGGRLVVVGHHSDNPTAGVGGPQDRSVLYRPEDVVRHLAPTRLVVVRAQTLAREVPGADRAALDTLVVADRR